MPNESPFVSILREAQRPMTSLELRQTEAKMREAPRSSVTMAKELYRLTAAGKLKRATRGLYILPHWEYIAPGLCKVDDNQVWDSVSKSHRQLF